MKTETERILTSEIKKGDRVIIMRGSDGKGKITRWYEAISDAYKYEGIWSFDFHEEYRYGFQSEDTSVEIRKRK